MRLATCTPQHDLFYWLCTSIKFVLLHRAEVIFCACTHKALPLRLTRQFSCENGCLRVRSARSATPARMEAVLCPASHARSLVPSCLEAQLRLTLACHPSAGSVMFSGEERQGQPPTVRIPTPTRTSSGGSPSCRRSRFASTSWPRRRSKLPAPPPPLLSPPPAHRIQVL